MPTQEVIAAQLGRPLRAQSTPVWSCHLGLPVVIEVPPVLDDGTPFPTLYWLSCPLAVRRVARLESRGDIALMETQMLDDPDLQRRLAAAHERYRLQRDELIPIDAVHRPSGGVAGAIAGVKCLHAHYADHAAGRALQSWDNPIGEKVAEQIEPLNCVVPCVARGARAVSDSSAGWQRNPGWIEPKLNNAPT